MTTIANVAAVERPDADYSLTDEQADVWRAVLDALPADWIGAASLPVLSAYCRTVVAMRRIGQLIYQCETEDGVFDPDRHLALILSHGQQAQVLKTLATSLRLTPQANMRAEKAGRDLRDFNPGPRPWEAR